MKLWEIPVSWEMCGVVKVKANTLEEAMKIARDDDNNIELPHGFYVDGSWALSTDDTSCIRECYNGGQSDD